MNQDPRATWGKVLLLLALAAAWGYAGWRSGVIKGKGWRAAVIESGCHLRCPAPGGAEVRSY